MIYHRLAEILLLAKPAMAISIIYVDLYYILTKEAVCFIYKISTARDV